MSRARDEKKLLARFRQLPDEQAKALMDFARFLSDRYGGEDVSQIPLDIQAIEDESVMAAIKRLRKSYPMLDAQDLFAEVSGLMGAHLTGGRKAEAVIEELEVLFQKHYHVLKDINDNPA